MESIILCKATKNGIKALSRMIEEPLEDRKGKFYQDNVVKFGIPEEYVKKAFSGRSFGRCSSIRKGNSPFDLEE